LIADFMSRKLAVFGKLKDCVSAVAAALTRTRKLPSSSTRMHIEAFQGEAPEIECRKNNVSF
jgi:hypothetical protein